MTTCPEYEEDVSKCSCDSCVALRMDQKWYEKESSEFESFFALEFSGEITYKPFMKLAWIARAKKALREKQ